MGGFIGASPPAYMKARRYSMTWKRTTPLRQIGFDERPSCDLHPLATAKSCRRRRHRRVLEERLDDQHQTVPLQDRIGIHPATRVMRDVDPGVTASPRPPCSLSMTRRRGSTVD